MTRTDEKSQHHCISNRCVSTPLEKILIRKNINVNVRTEGQYVKRRCERDEELLFYTCQSSPGAGSRPYLIRFFRGCSPNYECDWRIELFGIFEFCYNTDRVHGPNVVCYGIK